MTVEVWVPVVRVAEIRDGDIVRRTGTTQRLRVSNPRTTEAGHTYASFQPVRKDGQRDRRWYIGWSGLLADNYEKVT